MPPSRPAWNGSVSFSSASKRFAVVLEEQALRTWFGTARYRPEQLDRLLEIMSMPTVSLGIIPLMTERTAVASAGFWIFDAPWPRWKHPQQASRSPSRRKSSCTPGCSRTSRPPRSTAPPLGR